MYEVFKWTTSEHSCGSYAANTAEAAVSAALVGIGFDLDQVRLKPIALNTRPLKRIGAYRVYKNGALDAAFAVLPK